MKFIKETITSILKRKQPSENNNLTKEQKKKYRTQYQNTMIMYIPILFILIYGIGNNIYTFLTTEAFADMAIIIVLVLALETILQRAKTDIELIEERIQKRQQKNKKQGKEQ